MRQFISPISRRSLVLAIAAILASPAFAQDQGPPKTLEKIEVKEYALPDDARPKLNFLMKEVDGAMITVTKKTSITKLDRIPTVVDNNLRALFAQTPGLFISEQQTPGQFNLSYRGIGNPQEAEFVTVLQDGIPLEADWIGYPTIYSFPLPQSIEQVQLIRGGSSLLYGPQPPPVINLISRKPVADRPLAGYTENIIGKDGLFATYNRISGTSGKWDYLVDAHYRRTDGQRDNAESRLRGADFHIGYRPNEDAYYAVDLRNYLIDAGDPGKQTFKVYDADENATPTPFNHIWTDRYTLSFSHDRTIDDQTKLFAKAWVSYADQASRSAQGYLPATATYPAQGNAAPSTTQLQDDQFRVTGLDARVVHRWGRGNAFTIGTTLYHSDAPFRQWVSSDLTVDRYQRYQSICATPSARNCQQLDHDRSTSYAAVFAENVFRFDNGWHVVPSLRIDHESVDINELVKPARLSRPIVDQKVDHTVPLFGIGAGNDFGNLNESYFNVSQGWRPVRYFDVGSPFGNTDPTFNNPDPTHTLSYEAGVHGTPVPGLFYDASLFWVNVKDRIESQPTGVGNNTINVNTGDTRHRGFEGQIDYDFLAASNPQTTRHFSLYANVSLLNAQFTSSRDPSRIDNKPAFSPRYLARVGVVYREDQRMKVALSVQSVASQYFQDSNLPVGNLTTANYVPAKVPSYTVADLSGDFYVTPQLRLLGGVSNLTDKKYYSRVFQNTIEPALGRSYYVGAAYEF